MLMKVYRLAHNIGLIDVAPPITGFEDLIGIYVLGGDKIALIDVGPSVSLGNLFSGLEELGISPQDVSYILVTHIHLDHNGGIGGAIKQMPNAIAIVHERGKPHLADPARLWKSSQHVSGELAFKYGQPEPVPRDRMLIAKEGMTINLGGMEIEVLLTPGHASHHLSFLERKKGRLFVGEAAGVYIEDIDLVRPATARPFHLVQTLATLDRLISVDPIVLCYSHFGCATGAQDKLRAYKQQLILWGNVIAEQMADKADLQDIYNKIKERDRSLERLNDLPPDQRQRELYFAENSIKGYIDYFKKYGVEHLKRLS